MGAGSSHTYALLLFENHPRVWLYTCEVKVLESGLGSPHGEDSEAQALQFHRILHAEGVGRHTGLAKNMSPEFIGQSDSGPEWRCLSV